MEFPEEGALVADSSGNLPSMHAESRERACGLADGPLDWMQAKGAVGDVGGADVLARSKQVIEEAKTRVSGVVDQGMETARKAREELAGGKKAQATK